MNPRVLIATAWWPTKTRCFDRWSRGVARQLTGDVDLFITTRFSDSKFKSIVEAMTQAQAWAFEHGFTHLFNLEADKELPEGSLDRLLQRDKPVVLMGRSSGSGMSPFSLKELDIGYGWGSMLVQMSVLEKIPFEIGFSGEFITPDRVWFKRLFQLGIPAWVDHDCPVVTLEPAARGALESFKPVEIEDGQNP